MTHTIHSVTQRQVHGNSDTHTRDRVTRQGAATPIYTVLAAATGIKMQSMDQDCLTATVKKSKALSGVDQTIKSQF